MINEDSYNDIDSDGNLLEDNGIDVVRMQTCFNDYYFTRYFNETKENFKPFSTIKWLKSLDKDSFTMLYKDLNSFLYEDEEIDVESACDLTTFVSNIARCEDDTIPSANCIENDISPDNLFIYFQNLYDMMDSIKLGKKKINTYITK